VGTELKRPGEVYCRREVAWGAELNINPDMIRRSPHVQVGLLGAVEVPCMAEDRVEAVRVVLDGGVE
jgi:hypothetical protein